MSVSSNTTLISPSATLASGSHHHPSDMPHPPARRVSHGTGHHHAHVKRRTGSSTHVHTAHTTHTHAHAHGTAHAGPSRRSSEGEHGRRAMAAGLTMASMEPGKPKRKGSGDRPLKKNSRSDTNLPRLSRVNSHASATSSHSRPNSRSNSRHSSRANSPVRPDGADRKRSDTSVQLDEKGNEVAEVDSGEEGWEDESKRSRPETPRTAAQGSQEMRRTRSDTHAAPIKTSRSGINLAETEARPPPMVTRKTTGFAGPTQIPDPAIATPSHALNDPTHIMPAHQIKHQQSARSLHALQAMQAESEGKTLGRRSDVARRSMTGMSRTNSSASVDGKEEVKEVKRVESGLSMTKTAGDTPPLARPAVPAKQDVPDTPAEPNDPSDMRKGSEPRPEVSGSPSYPFPRLLSEADGAQTALSTSPSTIKPPTPPIHNQQRDEPVPRSRQISTASTNNGPRTLRHRYSNSSIRSIQSLRAPPHPLNSPTGYRTGIHPSASAHTSPMKAKGPSMHHPPIAPPVINRDRAEGMRWTGAGIPEDASMTRVSLSTRRTAPNGTAGTAKPGTAGQGRTSSFSSVRSITNLLGSTSLGQSASSSNTLTNIDQSASSSSRPGPNRRPTAFEATAKASRLRSTADPAAYHASLGFPSSTADTAHLISRFLPPPKTSRPVWEIPADAARDGFVGIGLTNGDYREGHEGLVRTMMSMGVEKGGGRTGLFRGSSALGVGNDGTTISRQGGGNASTSKQGISVSSIDEVVGVGMIKGSKGGLVVSRGGWEGRSPFLLSVDRCLAQKPHRAIQGVMG